jgi:hypothetical protein
MWADTVGSLTTIEPIAIERASMRVWLRRQASLFPVLACKGTAHSQKSLSFALAFCFYGAIFVLNVELLIFLHFIKVYTLERERAGEEGRARVENTVKNTQ